MEKGPQFQASSDRLVKLEREPVTYGLSTTPKGPVYNVTKLIENGLHRDLNISNA